MLIFESQSLDVYRNLAIEEFLMDGATDQGPILFLWRSECAVVMGKNQNPWRECRLDRMQQEQVPLARRISGGGTVYHDEGNLNYCVIVDRTAYKEEMAYDMVFRALETFGIRAEKTGTSNLSVDGLKFSGNAFAFRKNRALHHGTLLLNTDLHRLNRYLGSMFDSIETHAIASVPANVMNLSLAAPALVEALKTSFLKFYADDNSSEVSQPELDEEKLCSLMERQMTEAWIYEATPRFSIKLNGEQLEVSKGRIQGSGLNGTSFREYAYSLFC